MDEEDKLGNVLKVISPTSTGVVEFGGHFIDAFIQTVEIALGYEYDMVSWYVFENEFGARKLSISHEGVEKVVDDDRSCYDTIMWLKTL